MKELNMCRIIPRGSCPNCGGKQFIVFEATQSMYLTGIDGEIIDSKELKFYAVGKCCKCNMEYEMLPTTYGFIPLTRLRKICFEYHEPELLEEVHMISNPMEVQT